MNFFEVNKSFGYILATLLCLVFLGATYFFIYLPANERRVEEQRFRTLQNIDRNIHYKVENSVSLLNNLLVNYDDSSKEYLDSYISNYSKDKFILSAIEEVLPQDTNKLKHGFDSAVNIVVNDTTGLIKVTLQKPHITGKGMLQVSLKFTFKQFLVDLLPQLVFDEYIVFSKGNTVYESFPSGINKANEDTLLNIKNGIGGSYVKNITAGGTNYKFFLQPVTFEQDKKWVLGGLLSVGRYQKERSQLPAGIIMLMVTLVLTMIVIFPWVKLYQMGSKDRLTLIDGASCIIVTILLTSLLFFCFFKYNVSFRTNGTTDSKKVLADKITNAFYDETIKHYYILKAFDSIRISDKIDKNIIRLQGQDLRLVNKNSTRSDKGVSTDSSIRAAFNRIKDTTAFIKQVFWLDSNGNEIYNWTREKQNAPLGNYASRNYFRNINENRGYYIDNENTKSFYVDQVVSWTTATFTSLVSLRSESEPRYVAAMSFTMKSVEDPVLPTGYSFAIVDKHGKVLYHSFKARNLNENIKSEFSDSGNITSCLDAGIEGEFTTNYYSKNYSVRVTPFHKLPYFIIIFSDTSYKEIRDIEIYSFTFSMLLLLFLYIVLQLSITFLVSSRRSFFKKQLFDTSRTGPKVLSHTDYVLSSVLNLLVIIMLIFFFQRSTFLQYIFLLLFSVTFVLLFITRLLAVRYYKEGKKSKSRYKMLGVYWLLALLVFLNIYFSIVLEDFHFLAIFFLELLLAGAAWLLTYYTHKVPGNIRNAVANKLNYTHSYALMALTGLIITSGIPVAFFYVTSYNYEQNLGIRHRQTDYVNQILEHRKLNFIEGSHQISFDTTAIYYDRSWISQMPTAVKYDRINFEPANSYEDSQTIRWLGTFRLAIGDKANRTSKLFIPYSTDTSIVYEPLFINASADSSVTTYRRTDFGSQYIQLNSLALNYIIPSFVTRRGVFFWLLLVFTMLIFYFIIHNIVKKLFCLNLPNLELWKELDDKLLTENKLNKFLFVIGLPGAGKLTRILDKIKDRKIQSGEKKLIYEEANIDNTVLLADFINIPDKGTDIEKDTDWIIFKKAVVDPKYNMVIINHFEYNMQDEFTNVAKLNLLEELMLKSKCKILVLSTIHPVAFLDSINENANKNDPTAKNAHDLERWHVLLGHYRISIMPITKVKTTFDPAWHQLLSTETDYTHFLRDMQGATLQIAGRIREDEVDEKTDELAYKLQVTAHYFYMYIWQSLTKEEKFLLYDLAEDNLVNSYDDYNLTMLIAKGVIINTEGPLHFFNRGFRNFILTAIGNTEAMKIKQRIKQNGNWRNLKIPLIIVILALLSFLLISQQEAYSKLLTYVAALSAGVPAVLKIFSLFDKNTAKSNNG